MQMIRQHADCDGFEGIPFLDRCIDAAEAVDVAHQDVARPVGKCDREEEDATLDVRTAVVRHGAMIATFFRPRHRKTWARGPRGPLCPPYKRRVLVSAGLLVLLFTTPLLAQPA